MRHINFILYVDLPLLGSSAPPCCSPSSEGQGEQIRWRMFMGWDRDREILHHGQNRLNIPRLIFFSFFFFPVVNKLEKWELKANWSHLLLPPPPRWHWGIGNKGCGKFIILSLLSLHLHFLPLLQHGVPPMGYHPSQTDPAWVSMDWSSSWTAPTLVLTTGAVIQERKLEHGSSPDSSSCHTSTPLTTAEWISGPLWAAGG